MPQLTGRFGPIPQTVVLDGSGNGAITFQPNGSNARVTTLFVKVDTATNQAVVTLYKGQIADSNIIGNTNSGSTGAPAFGNIDLMDGETLYVVWRGGDPGATATATFTGRTIPFEEIGDTNIRWDDPIAAGDGSLIFPALKSPNYVADVSGWYIGRDGTVEFEAGTFRGDVRIVTASRVVEVNSGGLTVTDLTSPGAYAQVTTGPAFGGALELQPANSAVPGVAFEPSRVYARRSDNGVISSVPQTIVQSPNVAGTPDKEQAILNLYGEASDSSSPPIVDFNGRAIPVYLGGADSSTASPAIGNAVTLVLSSGTLPFRAGRAYKATVQCEFVVSVGPNRPLFSLRRSSTAGPLLRECGKPAISTIQHQGDFSAIFTASVDTNRSIVFCATTNTAAFTVTILGSPTQVIDVWEIGDAADYPNCPAIT